MRKCPNCKKNPGIPIFSVLFSKSFYCKKCGSQIEINKKAHFIMSILSIVSVVVLFVLSIPISDNLIFFICSLLGLFVVFSLVQIFLVPFEIRS